MSDKKKYNKGDFLPTQKEVDEFNALAGTDFTLMEMKMCHDMAIDVLNDGKLPEMVDPKNN